MFIRDSSILHKSCLVFADKLRQHLFQAISQNFCYGLIYSVAVRDWPKIYHSFTVQLFWYECYSNRVYLPWEVTGAEEELYGLSCSKSYNIPGLFKEVGNPSGPGTLLPLSENRAFLISPRVISTAK